MMLICCWNVFWTDHLQMMIEMMPLFRKRTRTWKGTWKGVDETHLYIHVNQACNIYKYWSYDRNLRLLSRNAGCVCWEVSQQSPGECFVWVADFCCFSLTLGSPMINPVSIPLGFFIWHTMTVIKSTLAYWK